MFHTINDAKRCALWPLRPHLHESGSAIKSDPRLERMPLDVHAAEGKVVLRGKVPNAETKQRVEGLARYKLAEIKLENELKIDGQP